MKKQFSELPREFSIEKLFRRIERKIQLLNKKSKLQAWEKRI